MQEQQESGDKRLDDQLAAIADELLNGSSAVHDKPPGDTELSDLQETVIDLARLGEEAEANRDTAERIRTNLIREWVSEHPQPIWERATAWLKKLESERSRQTNRWMLVGAAGVLLIVLLAMPQDGTSLSASSGNTPAWMPVAGIAVVGLVAFLVARVYKRRD